MACCLMAASHYLSQCWLIISDVLWHSSEGNFTRDTSAINKISLKYYLSKISFKSPRGQWIRLSHVTITEAITLQHHTSAPGTVCTQMSQSITVDLVLGRLPVKMSSVEYLLMIILIDSSKLFLSWPVSEEYCKIQFICDLLTPY